MGDIRLARRAGSHVAMNATASKAKLVAAQVTVSRGWQEGRLTKALPLTRRPKHALELLGFDFERSAAGLRDAVVTPPRIVITAGGDVRDELLLEELLDRVVERSWAHLDIAVRARLHLRSNAKSVPLLVGEREKDVER